MADPRIKSMKIKTGIVKRVYKEIISYEKESVQIQEKIKKMQEQGEEVYYIKKQDGLLQETNNVITDCQKRLNTAHQELTVLVENETELAAAAEYIAAKSMIEEARPHLTA